MDLKTTGCIWKAPKLIKLFQSTSQRLLDQLSSCTGPWVNDLLGYNASAAKSGETPWYILLDLLETWMANVARSEPEKAQKIGHQAEDLIKTCYFAGKKCDPKKDFKAVFHAQHGNCFTYSMVSLPKFPVSDWIFLRIRRKRPRSPCQDSLAQSLVWN